MADPSGTNRVTPTNAPLRDGFSTKVVLGDNSNIDLWEISVQPPGVDGEDPIDTSTMFNTVWRTFKERSLKTLTEITFTAAYAPSAYTEIIAAINNPDTITVVFPDGSYVAFFGYLKSFVPDQNSEGERPTAQCTIQPTQWDADNGVEPGTGLVYGTGY